MAVNWRIFSLLFFHFGHGHGVHFTIIYWIKKRTELGSWLLFGVYDIGNIFLHTIAQKHAPYTVILYVMYFIIPTKNRADANKNLFPSNKSQEIFSNGDDNASFLFDWFRSQIWVIISGNRDWYIMMWCVLSTHTHTHINLLYPRARKPSTKLIS